jgi:hypothetical protein
MVPKNTQVTTEAETPANNDCFIIMPIADHSDYKQGHFKRVYEDIFKPACIAAGYRPVRADDTKQANLIQLDILQKLLESPMAICDLSTRNPNVLFELGLRQAFDKPTILVQEEGTPRIFDINIFRYVEYKNGLDYRDVLADQRAIKEVLEETKQAVADGKSVNSIIKLLSMTSPAVLQDSSNFGEKEYLELFMSELKNIKNAIAMSQNNKRNEFIDHVHTPKIDVPINTDEFITVYFSSKVDISDLDNFYNALDQMDYIYSLHMDKNNLTNEVFLAFKTSVTVFTKRDIESLSKFYKAYISRIELGLPF